MTDEERKERVEAQDSTGADNEPTNEIEWEIESSELNGKDSRTVAEFEVQPEPEGDAGGDESGIDSDLPKPGAQVPEPVPDPEVEAAKADKKQAKAAERESAEPEETGAEESESSGPEMDSKELPVGEGEKQFAEERVGEASAVRGGGVSEPPPPSSGRPAYGEEWNWREVRSGFRPFVFDHMSELYRFSKGRADRISDLSQMSGYFTYLVHFEESPSLGLLTLNTDKKYAKVLARKNLEEMGELSSEGVLKVYDTRKMEGGQVSVFYEVLPRDKHITISETYRSYNAGFIIHDSVSLLYGLLKRAGRGVHAYALHLPGSIVLVGGRNGNVHLSRRYTLVGEDEQAMVEGIHAMAQDLQAMERNMGQRLDRVDWIEGLAWDLDIPKPAVEVSIMPMPLHKFTLDGYDVWSALPTAIARSQNQAAIGPKEEQYLRPLERAEKLAWAVLLALAVVAGVGVYSMMDVTKDMDASIRAMRNKMNAMEAQIQARKVDTEFSALEPTLDLAKNFRRAAVSPPFGEMWNYLAAIKPEDVRVDGLDFNYQPDQVLIRLEGEVQRDLSAAQYLYNGFLEDLEKAGFEVLAQQLDLGVDGNFYSLNMSWPLNKTE